MNAQGIGTGYGQLANTTRPIPTSSIDAQRESLASAGAQLYEQVQRARGIADDYFGAQPQGVNSKDTSPAPTQSKAEALARDITALHGLVAELSVQMDRLSCV